MNAEPSISVFARIRQIGESALASSHKGLLLVLLEWADVRTGGNITASVATIASRASLSERRVQTLLRELSTLGVLTSTARVVNGLQRSSVRGICFAKLFGLGQDDAGSDASGTGEAGDRGAAGSAETGIQGGGRGEAGGVSGVMPASPKLPQRTSSSSSSPPDNTHADPPAAAAGRAGRGGKNQTREILEKAGVGDPTLGEFDGLPTSIAQCCVDEWRQRGGGTGKKGVGALVGNLRAALKTQAALARTNAMCDWWEKRAPLERAAIIAEFRGTVKNGASTIADAQLVKTRNFLGWLETRAGGGDSHPPHWRNT